MTTCNPGGVRPPPPQPLRWSPSPDRSHPVRSTQPLGHIYGALTLVIQGGFGYAAASALVSHTGSITSYATNTTPEARMA